MYEFTLPDYYGTSIINLMSSLSNGFDRPHEYKELSAVSSQDIQPFDNVVLVVIDGLGYNYLKKQANSFLSKHCSGQMTTTFLSTTACANTAFCVGYPPQQHGLTGWDINLKEVGAVTTILPFRPMFGGAPLSSVGFCMDDIIDIGSFHKGFNGHCFTFIDKKHAYSPFTRYVSQGTEILSTRSYESALTDIRNLISEKSSKRRFIYAYMSELDSAAHKKGIGSERVSGIFTDMDVLIEDFSKSITGTNTILIITADHGLVDVLPEEEIWIENIDGLKECLTIPLAGEARVRDCFVRPGKVRQFEHIAEHALKENCWCFKGEELIRDNLYGLGEPNKKLLDRVGDYVLVMKGNYILRDKLANYKKRNTFIPGQHGGVSDDEMLVPLIVLEL